MLALKGHIYLEIQIISTGMKKKLKIGNQIPAKQQLAQKCVQRRGDTEITEKSSLLKTKLKLFYSINFELLGLAWLPRFLLCGATCDTDATNGNGVSLFDSIRLASSSVPVPCERN